MAEVRHLRLETRFLDGADEGAIEGIASRFDEADGFGDIVRRGAFAESIRRRQSVPLLWSHDPAAVVGRITSMEETAEGLRIRGRLAVGITPLADEVRGLIREGFVDGLSIGFRVREARAGRNGQRIVEAIDLHEVSVVAMPAAERARVTDVRGAVAPLAEESEMTDETTAAAAETAAIEERGIDTRAIAEEVRTGLRDELQGITSRLDDLEVRLQRPGAPRREADGDREMRAFAAFLRHGDRISDEERRSLRVEDGPAGGFLAPAQFANELISVLTEISPVPVHGFETGLWVRRRSACSRFALV